MEDRVLDRLVALGFIKEYEYTQEVPLPEDDDLEKEVLILYFDDVGTKIEIQSASVEDSWLSIW
jgi:hypothetical protein